MQHLDDIERRPAMQIAESVTPPALPLLYLDEHMAVVDKPAGLLVHRSSLDAHEDDAALQRLRDQLGRPVWPVHRLDKGTSGVLVFALSAEVAGLLGRTLAERESRKRYIALVRGWPADAQGLVDHALARDPELPSRGQVLLEAQTEWRCLRRLASRTPGGGAHSLQTDARFPVTRLALLECQPVQGRRHQIRRHLKHMAHPIIGDANHGKGPLNRALAAYLGLQRLWLHAQTLEIRHPLTGTTLEFVARPGPEWARWMEEG